MSQPPTVLVSLIGEQPTPNVLPLRHYKPDQVILVHTDLTAGLAGRIAALIEKEFHVLRPYCRTDAFLVDRIRSELLEYIGMHAGKADLIFNLTGGTKTMEYAALDVARQCKAKAFYYQTEGNQSLIHPYHFDEQGEMACEPPIEIDAVLQIEEFLKLFVKDYRPAEEKDHEGKAFEQMVLAVLESLGPDYEVMPNQRLSGFSHNVELDWVLRYRNTFAVGEVKLHGTKSAGIDQLNSATDQRMLGTYTKKFLVSVDPLHKNDADLVIASRISTVVLPSGRQAELSGEDKDCLRQAIRKAMEPKRHDPA